MFIHRSMYTRGKTYIELLFSAILQLDVLFSESSDGIVLDIHQLNVWAVKLLKVVQPDV